MGDELSQSEEAVCPAEAGQEGLAEAGWERWGGKGVRGMIASGGNDCG